MCIYCELSDAEIMRFGTEIGQMATVYSCKGVNDREAYADLLKAEAIAEISRHPLSMDAEAQEMVSRLADAYKALFAKYGISRELPLIKPRAA